MVTSHENSSYYYGIHTLFPMSLVYFIFKKKGEYGGSKTDYYYKE
jgi:hypothetical protein